MATTETLPAHVQHAAEEIRRVDAEFSFSLDAARVAALALHRAGLLAGDRDCSCQGGDDDRRERPTHQRGDEAFCRDSFEAVERPSETGR